MPTVTKQQLAPGLRFPGFQAAWSANAIGKCGKFLPSLVGKTAEDFGKGNAHYVTYMNVFSNTFTDVHSLGLVNVAPGEKQNAVRKGDVFFTVSSETSEDAGMSSVLMDEIENCYLNSFCTIFRFDEDEAPSSRFIGYYFRSKLVRSYLSRNAQGFIRANVSKDVFNRLPVFVPTPAEQQKIAECLSTLDELIGAESQKLDALKAYKKGLMQQLFPLEGETLPRLRFPEFQSALDWETKDLNVIAGPVLDRATNKETNIILTLSGERGLVLQSEYFGKKIAGGDAERYLSIRRDDFVYNDRTTKAFSFGTIKRLTKHLRGIVSPIYKCFRFAETEEPSFWEQYFEAGTHNPELRTLANEGARTGRFNVSIDRFLSTKVRAPQRVEQQRIAACLFSLDELIAAQSDKLEILKTHKRGLMQQLFPSPTGSEA